jgi:hypothetical protein
LSVARKHHSRQSRLHPRTNTRDCIECVAFRTFRLQTTSRRLIGQRNGGCAVSLLVVQKGHQVFNLARQQGLLERGHTPTTISYLPFDLTLIATLANVAEVWPKASTIAVDAMTMLTSSFMEKDGAGDFIASFGVARIRSRRLQKTAHSQGSNAPGANDSEDSHEPSNPSRGRYRTVLVHANRLHRSYSTFPQSRYLSKTFHS